MMDMDPFKNQSDGTVGFVCVSLGSQVSFNWTSLVALPLAPIIVRMPVSRWAKRICAHTLWFIWKHNALAQFLLPRSSSWTSTTRFFDARPGGVWRSQKASGRCSFSVILQDCHWAGLLVEDPTYHGDNAAALSVAWVRCGGGPLRLFCRHAILLNDFSWGAACPWSTGSCPGWCGGKQKIGHFGLVLFCCVWLCDRLPAGVLDGLALCLSLSASRAVFCFGIFRGRALPNVGASCCGRGASVFV